MSEVSDEKRFSFGANWSLYVDSVLDAKRLEIARESLQKLLDMESLQGKSFLDIGSGSGLFSLAAFGLGATSITSFDYDMDSVQTTERLRERVGNPDHWTVFQGSILDDNLIARYQADIVYSWGVLHHTGSMWKAIRNAAAMVNPGGLFAIAIYNRIDRWRGGGSSATWAKIKRYYVNSPVWRQRAIIALAKVHFFLYESLIARRNPFKIISDYRQQRGMSWHTDLVDWVGGYPFEYASVEEIVRFCEDELGLKTLRVFPQLGHACNEFVFTR